MSASKPKIFYNSIFKTILINPHHFEDHKEISNLIDSFIKTKLNPEIANYTVRRILQILNSLQNSHLPYYDKLFHKHFSFPYYNDLKKYLPFYFSNITKIKKFKNQKRFSHHINRFLDGAVSASNHNSIPLQLQIERQNELYLKIVTPLIFSVTMIFIAMLT